MVERNDPARAGVKAGRVVGLLTAALAVATLLADRRSFYRGMRMALDAFGVGFDVPLPALFWGNALIAASARYAIAYVVGSLVGVAYDWLDRPSLAVLTGMVLVVGVVDGVLAGLDALSVAVGAAHVLAWLCYVPVFAWLFDDEGETREGPVRLGDS